MPRLPENVVIPQVIVLFRLFSCSREIYNDSYFARECEAWRGKARSTVVNMNVLLLKFKAFV